MPFYSSDRLTDWDGVCWSIHSATLFTFSDYSLGILNAMDSMLALATFIAMLAVVYRNERGADDRGPSGSTVAVSKTVPGSPLSVTQRLSVISHTKRRHTTFPLTTDDTRSVIDTVKAEQAKHDSDNDMQFVSSEGMAVKGEDDYADIDKMHSTKDATTVTITATADTATTTSHSFRGECRPLSFTSYIRFLQVCALWAVTWAVVKLTHRLPMTDSSLYFHFIAGTVVHSFSLCLEVSVAIFLLTNSIGTKAFTVSATVSSILALLHAGVYSALTMPHTSASPDAETAYTLDQLDYVMSQTFFIFLMVTSGLLVVFYVACITVGIHRWSLDSPNTVVRHSLLIYSIFLGSFYCVKLGAMAMLYIGKDAGICLYDFSQCAYIALYAIVLYYTLTLDSHYWQSLLMTVITNKTVIDRQRDSLIKALRDAKSRTREKTDKSKSVASVSVTVSDRRSTKSRSAEKSVSELSEGRQGESDDNDNPLDDPVTTIDITSSDENEEPGQSTPPASLTTIDERKQSQRSHNQQYLTVEVSPATLAASSFAFSPSSSSTSIASLSSASMSGSMGPTVSLQSFLIHHRELHDVRPLVSLTRSSRSKSPSSSSSALPITLVGSYQHQPVVIRRYTLPRLNSSFLTDHFANLIAAITRTQWVRKKVETKHATGKGATKSSVSELLVRNERVIQVFGVSVDAPTLSLVVECAPNGSLYDRLHGLEERERRASRKAKGNDVCSDSKPLTLPPLIPSSPSPSLPPSHSSTSDAFDAFQCFLDIADGMRHFHALDNYDDHPILLKSSHIVIDENFRTKISDIGAQSYLQPRASHRRLTLTAANAAWIAPEVLAGFKHTRAADVYAFGIVVWELLTHKLPFVRVPNGDSPTKSIAVDAKLPLLFGVPADVSLGMSHLAATPIRSVKQAHRLILVEKLRPPIPASCPAWLSRLLAQCWDNSPEERPTFDILAPFIEQQIKNATRIRLPLAV